MNKEGTGSKETELRSFENIVPRHEFMSKRKTLKMHLFGYFKNSQADRKGRGGKVDV